MLFILILIIRKIHESTYCNCANIRMFLIYLFISHIKVRIISLHSLSGTWFVLHYSSQ